MNDRRIEGIRDVRNDVGRATPSRLVIDLKRDANAQVVLNQLYKHTPMQTNFAANMLALVDGVPRLLNLRRRSRYYVAHQVEVLTRRSEYRLRQGARPRAHPRRPAEGARHDRRDHHADPRLGVGRRGAHRRCMLAPFEFSETQATHILDMPLRRLAALERQKLRDEFDELRGDDRRARGDPRRRGEAARRHQGRARPRSATSTATSGAREITHDPGDLADLDLIEDEELVVVLSQKGYVKTVPVDQFRTQGRGGKGVRGGNLRDEDYVEHLLTTHRALVPVVLLQPRPGLPARARTRSR